MGMGMELGLWRRQTEAGKMGEGLIDGIRWNDRRDLCQARHEFCS
jgi:hypothetical protein